MHDRITSLTLGTTPFIKAKRLAYIALALWVVWQLVKPQPLPPELQEGRSLICEQYTSPTGEIFRVSLETLEGPNPFISFRDGKYVITTTVGEKACDAVFLTGDMPF